MKKGRKKIKRVNAWMVITTVLLLVIVIAFLSWTQLKRYERGILSVYARQQDGYVQLVLDQINLQENRDSEEIIENILGTLDTSDSHYWTLSEKNSLIFVKDVLETNRFKGFTTETYYQSESADAFLKNLQENRVTHGFIEINSRGYVASGVNYTYNGKSYRMCLLTGEASILDQNDYLNAKICLTLLVVTGFFIIIIGGIFLVIQAEHWYKRYDEADKECRSLAKTVEELNRELTQKMMYDSEYMAFKAKVLPNLLRKMEQKNIWPLEMTVVKVPEGYKRRFFFAEAQILFSEKTIRVVLDDIYVLLLDMQHLGMVASERKKQISKMDGEMVYRELLETKPEESLEEIFVKLYKEGLKDG